MKKIAIIGSHGLYANYGGWDQLVRNLAEKKSEDFEYLIFNSSDTSKDIEIPPGVKVKWLNVKASGFQGIFYDFWSILICFYKVDTLLLLGVQGILIVPFLRMFRKKTIVSNVGGVEWERPKFNFFAKKYLKLCFNLSFKYSDFVILDNEHYNKYSPKNRNSSKVKVIPYGGEIDTSLNVTDELRIKYPFIDDDYFLSISRSLEDNLLDELCQSFLGSRHKLVLISNFSKSAYGLKVYEKFHREANMTLIDGLYVKAELDLVRRKCKAYIHTHTLCGTAPSLVEMIIAQRPIFSKDIPQNRYTLKGEGCFFNSFSEVIEIINNKNCLSDYIPSADICKQYDWSTVVADYEKLF